MYSTENKSIGENNNSTFCHADTHIYVDTNIDHGV